MKFTPIVLILASILLFFFYIDPQYKEVQVKMDQQNDFQTSRDHARALEERQREKFAEFNQIPEQEKQRLTVMISTDSDKTRLFNTIAGIGSRNGVSLTQVELNENTTSSGRGTSQDAPTRGGLEEVSVGFTAEGSYQNFLRFLEDVERSLQIMDVKHIEIRPTAVGGYQYTVEVTAYSL